jgi:hypothetical protein
MADYQRNKREWNVGAFRYADVRIKPTVGGQERSDALQTVISIAGNYNCCDVWCNLPWGNLESREAGWQNVRLSLWGYDGEQRSMLVQKMGIDQEGIILPQNAAATERRAQAAFMSVRGRSVDGFEVLAEGEDLSREADFDRYGEAFFRIEAWGDDSQNANDMQGRTIIDPFAPRERLINTSMVLAVGNNAVLVPTVAWPDRERRVYITHLSVSTDDNAWQLVELQRLDALGNPTTVYQSWVSIFWKITENFTYALRGEWNGSWRIVLPGATGGTIWTASLIGFYE